MLQPLRMPITCTSGTKTSRQHPGAGVVLISVVSERLRYIVCRLFPLTQGVRKSSGMQRPSVSRKRRFIFTAPRSKWRVSGKRVQPYAPGQRFVSGKKPSVVATGRCRRKVWISTRVGSDTRPAPELGDKKIRLQLGSGAHV
jgi:hypothetical protein